MDDLHRIGVKVFCATGADIELAEFIPVFHRWIQEKRTSYMLIDIADYSHVPEGPGVLLVAHEGNFCLDEARGRRGLTLYRKQPLDGTFGERLASVGRHVVAAAIALAREPEFQDRLSFLGSELQVSFNDRLRAPNTDDAFSAIQGPVRAFCESALGGTDLTYTRDADVRSRLTITAQRNDGGDVARVASRLGV